MVWGDSSMRDSRTIDAYVRRLREKLSGSAAPTIVGVRGLGYQLHVWVGLAVLAMASLRLALRAILGGGPAASSGPALLEKGAGAIHALLYGLMFAVPLLGAAAWYAGIEDAADLHVLAVDGLMILAGLHAAAALFHQFVLKDHRLLRMMRAR